MSDCSKVDFCTPKRTTTSSRASASKRCRARARLRGFVGSGENVVLRNLIGTHMNHLACSLVKDPWWKRRGVRAASASSSASTGRSDCSWSTCDRSTSRTRSLVHAAGAVGVEGRNRLDRILCPVREEALAPEARRRGPRGRHHGQDRAQRSLGRCGRGQHETVP